MSTKESHRKASAASKTAYTAAIEEGELPLLYQRLVEMSPNGIIVNAEDRIVFANQIAADILGGVTPLDIVGRPMWDFILEGHRELFQERTKALLEDGEDVPTIQTALRRLDNTLVEVERSASAVTFRGKPASLIVLQDVSERVEMQSALEKSERNFRDLFNRSPIAYMPSIKGQILDANPKAEEVFGYTHEELVTMNKLDLTADTPAGREVLARGIEEGRSWNPPANLRVEMRHKDGSEVWVSVSSTTVRNDTDEIEGLGMFLDITKQVQAEQALEESRSIHQTTYDHMREGIVWSSPDGQITHANPSVLKMLEYTLEEIKTLGLRDLVPLEYQEVMLANQELVRQGAGFTAIEREWLKKDGSKVPVEVWASMVFRQDGTPSAIITGVMNLTQRKAGQALLRESEELYKDLFTRAPIAYMPSRNGAILDANPKAEEVFGYSKEELVTMSLLDLAAATPDGRDLLASTMKASRAGTPLETKRVEMRRKDGSQLWINISGAQHITPNGVVEGRGMFPDITEQVLADRKTQEAQAALARVQARYDASYHHLREGVGWINEAGRFTSANPALQNMLGYTEAEIASLSLSQLVAPEYLSNARRLAAEDRERVEAGEDLSEHKTVWLRKDGTQIPLEMWTRSIKEPTDGSTERMVVVRDLTAQNHAEEALRQSEERYRSLFDNAPIPYISSKSDHIFDANPKAAEELGYPLEELIGLPILSILPGEPELNRRRKQRMEDFKAGITSWVDEIPMLRKNGEQFTARFQSQLGVDAEGVFAGLAAFNDVTREKEAEEALRESEERYRRMFDHAPIPYFSTRENHVVAANPKAADALGYTVEELVGTHVKYLFPNKGGYSRRWKNRLKEFNAGLTHWDVERPMVRKNGEQFVAQFHGQMELDSGGVPVSLNAFSDVTQQKEAETALKASEERYQILFEGAPIPYMTVTDGVITAANPKAGEILDYSVSELVGTPIVNLVEDKDEASKVLAKHLEELAVGIDQWTDERLIIRRDGQVLRTLFQTHMNINQEGQRTTRAAFFDITQQKYAETALKASEERYRALFEGAPNPYITTTDGIITAANPKAAEMLGYTIDQVIGTHLLEFMEDKEAVLKTRDEHIQEMSVGINDWTSERLIRSKDGHVANTILKTNISMNEKGQRITNASFIDVTHEREMEEALRRSEERYHAIYESLQEGILQINEAGQIIGANTAIADLLGYTVQELITLPFIMLAEEGDKDSVGPTRQRIFAGEHFPPANKALVHKDGPPIPFEVSATTLTNQVGDHISMLLVARDLRPQLASEEALRNSEEGYRQLFDSAPIAYIASQGGYVNNANPMASKMLGYPLDELIGMPSENLFVDRADSKRRRAQSLKEFKRGLPEWDAEQRMLRKNGEEIIVQHRGILSQDSSGNRTGLGTFIDITQQKEAEEALRLSEERYRRLFDSAPIAYLVSKDGMITDANPMASEMFGYSQEELVGMEDTRLHPHTGESEKQLTPYEGQFVQIISEWDDEPTMVRKNGQEFIVRRRGQVTLDANGDQVGLGTFIDITRQKEAEEALRQSEEHYHAIYDNLNDAIVQVGENGEVLEANQAFADLLEYTQEELTTASFYDMVPADKRELMPSMWHELMANGVATSGKRTLVAKDGTIRPVENRISPIISHTNQPHSLLAVVRDLRPELEAQEALRQSEEHYHAIYDHLNDALIQIGPEGQILECNQAFIDLLGYTQEELASISFFDMVPTDNRAAMHEKWQSFVETGVYSTGQRELIAKDGTPIPVDNWTGPLPGTRGQSESVLSVFRDMRQQLTAQEALRQSEEHYHAIYDHLNDAVIQVGEQGEILEANRAFGELLGYSIEELSSISFFDLVPQDRRSQMPEKWQQTVHKDGSGSERRDLVAKDGSLRPTENWAGPLKSADDQSNTVLTVFRDMRQQLEDETALRRSEERYRTIYDLLEAGVVQFNLGGRITGANTAYTELTGFNVDELIARTLGDLASMESPGLIQKHRDSVLAGEFPPPEEREILHADGTRIPVEGTVRLLADENGEPEGFLVAWRDLRPEREAAEALRHSEERYRSIYESLNDGVLNVGRNGEILGCNQAFATLTGYSQEELSSMSLQDMARPEWKNKVVASINTILKGRYLEKVERALVNNEGIAVPVEMWSRALVQGTSNPTSIYLVARDLRPKHQAQQVNRELTVMEERTRLAREIHDTVAQTLTALVNQLDSTEYIVPQEMEDLIQQIAESKDLARACLSQTRSALLDLQPMELKPGGLTDGIRAEALGFQQRGLNVEVKVQGVEPVNANERSVLATYRIVQEALSNSYKHSKANSVTIELIYGPDDLVLQIVDDGVGFDVSAQRAQGQQGLTGFGMGVMDERSRVAGGELTIVSARGAGTRIIGRIPYTPSDVIPIIAIPEETVDGSSDSPPMDLGICRVLLVDDHELVRHGTKAWLEMVDDMEVVGEADTGEWAIVKAQELEPDIILMDIHMPSMNGIEATKRIMEALPGCKIILLTVYDDDDHVREGIRAGAKGYLVKGAGREEILSGIRTVFAGGSLVPASVLGSLAEGSNRNQGPGITAREREVLTLLASGAPTKQIAAELIVSENTVNYHLRNLYQKLGVKNRTQAIRASEAAGLLKSASD